MSCHLGEMTGQSLNDFCGAHFVKHWQSKEWNCIGCIPAVFEDKKEEVQCMHKGRKEGKKGEIALETGLRRRICLCGGSSWLQLHWKRTVCRRWNNLQVYIKLAKSSIIARRWKLPFAGVCGWPGSSSQDQRLGAMGWQGITSKAVKRSGTP